jgi:hypothetical protein
MPRRSKIEQQPAEIRAKIDRLLIKAGFAGYDWLAERIRDDFGVDAGGKSSVQRYGSKLQRYLGAVKASSEAARQIAEAAPDEADERSNAIISMVQTEIFEALLALQEAEQTPDPAKRIDILGKAAKNIATLTRASVARNKWGVEVRTRLEAALAQLKKEGKDGDTLDAVASQLKIYLPANNR